MAVKNTSYTLADILGEPITEQEALALIKQATDSDTFRSFNIMEEACRRKLLQFLMGKSGLSITYDSVFKHVTAAPQTGWSSSCPSSLANQYKSNKSSHRRAAR